MKRISPFLPLALIMVSFQGCGIGGFWMTGNPFYEPDIKPYLHYWVKPGMTEESRRKDSWECGAAKSIQGAERVEFTPEQEAAERRSGEDGNMPAYWRLRQEWDRCMKGKGYQRIEPDHYRIPESFRAPEHPG